MFVRRALLTVNDKTDLIDFARGLSALGIELLATSGTAASLQAAGVPVVKLADITGFPDAFLGGRIKTLQPAIYAGLLADRENGDHAENMERHAFAPIDLLGLNLYPFGSTDQDDTRGDAAITHIDIGGPMLLRAAALNHKYVAAVTRPSQYDEVLRLLKDNRNELPETVLSRLATQAFALVASYEAQVSAWFTEHYGEIADPAHTEPFRINWTRCTTCGGAVAEEGIGRCLRHLDPSVRRDVLLRSDGNVDLRNVQVAPSLMAEILHLMSGRDERPRLTTMLCEWTQFEGPISLRGAIFQGDVDFSGARFGASLDCDDVVIHGELRCRDTRFRPASFQRLRVERLATFRGADFREVSFESASFSGPAVFEASDFALSASFKGAEFRRDASFIGAAFHGETVFHGTRWVHGSRFRDASFDVVPGCDDLSRFQEATWPDAKPDRAKTIAAGVQPSKLPRVFIGSSREALPVATAVQRNLDHVADTVVWSQGVFRPGAVASESLRLAVTDVDFAIFVLGADDVVRLRDAELPVTRDNVIWELGLSDGILGGGRTFLIKPRNTDLRIPTDLAGVTPTDYDETRSNLVSALGAACAEIQDAMAQLGPRPDQ